MVRLAERRRRAVPAARRSPSRTRATRRSAARSTTRARRSSRRELAPMRQERLQREKELVERTGIAPNYIATFDALAGISRARAARRVRGVPARHAGDVGRRAPGVPASAASASRRPRRRAPTRSRSCARRSSTRRFRPTRWSARSGARSRRWASSPDADGRVALRHRRTRGEARRAPSARRCAIPDEVYLVLRPHGGQNDWQTLLHELGHALHFANMRRRRLPFEYRWLGDNSITEGLRDAVRPPHAGHAAGSPATRGSERERPAALPARGRIRGAAVPAPLLRRS